MRDFVYTEERAFLLSDIIDDLGTSERHSMAYGINGTGQIVGATDLVFSPLGADRAFLWDEGQLTDLGTLAGGDCCSQALDINDHTQIVGLSVSSRHFAFLWQDGIMVDLGSIEDRNTVARAINNAGTIVGYSQVRIPVFPWFRSRPVAWFDGQLTVLPPMGNGFGDAYAVNDSGQIVGVSGGFPVLWQNGAVEALSAGPGPTGTPLALNNSQQIVGRNGFGSPSGDSAVLWHESASYELNTLIPPYLVGRLLCATAINDLGQILATSYSSDTLILFDVVLTPIDCDADGDGAVDLFDFQTLQACLSGPAAVPGMDCEHLDGDRSGHIDLIDYRSFELALRPTVGP